MIDHPALKGLDFSWPSIETFLAVCGCARPLEILHDLASYRSLRVRLARFFFPASRLDYVRAIDAYLRDYLTLPDMWHDRDCGDHDEMHLPWTARMVRTLTQHWGFTHDQAWACPAGYAIHLHLAHAEAEGAKVPIISDTDRAMMDAVENAT